LVWFGWFFSWYDWIGLVWFSDMVWNVSLACYEWRAEERLIVDKEQKQGGGN